VKTLKMLEPEQYAKLEKKYEGKVPDFLYFNKGL
jgi:hypothetical protein